MMKIVQVLHLIRQCRSLLSRRTLSDDLGPDDSPENFDDDYEDDEGDIDGNDSDDDYEELMFQDDETQQAHLQAEFEKSLASSSLEELNFEKRKRAVLDKLGIQL